MYIYLEHYYSYTLSECFSKSSLGPPSGSVVKNPPANAGNKGLIPPR